MRGGSVLGQWSWEHVLGMNEGSEIQKTPMFPKYICFFDRELH